MNEQQHGADLAESSEDVSHFFREELAGGFVGVFNLNTPCKLPSAVTVQGHEAGADKKIRQGRFDDGE